MTEQEIRIIEQKLAALQATLDGLNETQNTRFARLEESSRTMAGAIATLCALRHEWERVQGLGSKRQAAFIGAIATLASLVASTVVTVAVQVMG